MPPSMPAGLHRLDSVDAMRGITVGAMVFANYPGDWSHVVGRVFSHSPWNGCTLMDLGFPTFLFIVGVSVAVGAGPRLDAGADMAGIGRAWWWRAARLVLLGWVLAAVAVASLPSPAGEHVPWRPMGILPRIGLCFALCGALYLHVGTRARWWIYAGLLSVYGAALTWWGDLSPLNSLPSRVDAWILGPLAFHYDPATGRGYDPEGVLSTLGALSNTLLGAQCGDWLRRGQWRPMARLGAALAALGLLLHYAWMPMNKSLWTPPFALFSGGFSALCLLAAHVLFDHWQLPPIGRRFGVNAITVFAGSVLVLCLMEGTPLKSQVYPVLSSWLTPIGGPKLPSHTYAALQVVFWWLVIRWMDQRRIRLSI